MIIVELFRYTWCSFFNNKKTSFTQFNRILTRNSVCSVYRLTRIVYYSPGVVLVGLLWWFTAVYFTLGCGSSTFTNRISALSFADCVNTNVALYSNTTESLENSFFLYMLIYACWSPICVAGPSVLYSGVPLQTLTGTDKNTDTYRDIYQERILRKN